MVMALRLLPVRSHEKVEVAWHEDRAFEDEYRRNVETQSVMTI